MKKFVKKNWITIVGIVVGAISGFLYWQFIGCNSGTCAITSSPINSTIYGALLGGLSFSMLKKDKKESTEQFIES